MPVERLIRRGVFTGPLVLNWVVIGGGADGPNPRNLLEFINRCPGNAVLAVESLMRNVLPAGHDGHRDGAARARRYRGQPLG